MYDLTIIQNYSLAGKSYAQNTTQSKPDVRGKEDLVPIAWAAVLTVRTNGTDGSLTMNDVGHLVTTGAVIDLYWLDPTTNAPMSCRAAVVGTVAGLVVPFTGALGTALPVATTVVQVGIVQVYTISGSIIGNDAAAILGGVDPGPAATIVLLDVVPSENLVMNIAPFSCYSWVGVGTNPIAGKTVITAHFSHNDLSSPRSVGFGVVATQKATKAYVDASAGGGGTSVSNSDGSITVAAQVVSLAVGHANTFTAQQTFRVAPSCPNPVGATGTENEMFGVGAGAALTTGSFNALFGELAGSKLTTGEQNVFSAFAEMTQVGLAEKGGKKRR